MAHGKKQILVVEDDQAVARLMKELLEGADYDVRTETHGECAIASAAERRPDVVILDINLPDLNGYHVAREMRQLSRPWTLPIIMLTVNDQPVDQLRGFAHGADAYLTKPFDAAELLHTVALLTGSPAQT